MDAYVPNKNWECVQKDARALVVFVRANSENGILGEATLDPELLSDVKFLMVARKVSVSAIFHTSTVSVPMIKRPNFAHDAANCAYPASCTVKHKRPESTRKIPGVGALAAKFLPFPNDSRGT